MFMKAIIIPLLVTLSSFYSATTSAQSHQWNISIDLGEFLPELHPNFNVEYSLGRNTSAFFDVLYATDRFVFGVPMNPGDPREFFNYSTFQFITGARFYFSKSDTYNDGFYLAPFFFYNTISSVESGFTLPYDSNILGAGTQIGSQWLTSNNISFDLGLNMFFPFESIDTQFRYGSPDVFPYLRIGYVINPVQERRRRSRRG